MRCDMTYEVLDVGSLIIVRLSPTHSSIFYYKNGVNKK